MWISGADGAIHAVLHSPSGQASTSVLMVPPFGWDAMESHRARRYWAIRLAAAGIPCLRIDLPGTGDSDGGARDPHLVDRWTAAVDSATSWLRATTGVERIAVIGIGFGGLIACRAVSEGAAIDDLILWGSRAKGRQVVREMLAYGGAVAGQFPADHIGHSPDDGADITGFLMSSATQQELSDYNVADRDLSALEHLRVLLLSRDALGIDKTLQSTFEDAGADVTTATTRDFRDLMAHPQSLALRRPESTIDLGIEWLGAASVTATTTTTTRAMAATATATATATSESPSSSVAEMVGESLAGRPLPLASESVLIRDGEDRVVRETIIDLEFPGYRGSAIVTEPAAGTDVVISALVLSSGALHKIGQHRMSVELSRRWAARGVRSVRFEVPAIGDAAGPGDLMANESDCVTEQQLGSPATLKIVADLLDELRRRGIGDRFVTVGHCLGAYQAFHAALTDPGVIAYFGVDQSIFQYSEAQHQGEMLSMIGGALRSGLLRRLRERGVTAHEVAQVKRALAYRLSGARRRDQLPEAELAGQMLDRLRDRDVDVLLLLIQKGELWDRMPAGGHAAWAVRWPNVSIEELPTLDHMGRALWLQTFTHARLDLALDKLLESLTSPGMPAAP